MDKILKSKRIRLEILPPLPQYAKQLSDLVKQNREHLDMWRGDVLKYETDELAFYKLLMDNYYYERDEGYFYHIMKDKKIIGHISAVSSGKVWEMAYWLDKNHTGKGYMCEAINTLERAWFQDRARPLTIFVKPQNIPSLNVVRKMNYMSYGTNRYFKNFTMFMAQYRQSESPCCVVSADTSMRKEHYWEGKTR